MADSRKRITHYRSSGTAKPSASNLLYGELAIGYGDGSETLYIKNSNNDITRFGSDEFIFSQTKNLSDVIGLTQSINNDLSTYKYNPSHKYITGATTVAGAIEKVAESVEYNEAVVSAAITKFNSQMGFDSNGNYAPTNAELKALGDATTVSDAIDHTMDSISTSASTLTTMIDDVKTDITKNEETVAAAINNVMYMCGFKETVGDFLKGTDITSASTSTNLVEKMNELYDMIVSLSGKVETLMSN